TVTGRFGYIRPNCCQFEIEPLKSAVTWSLERLVMVLFRVALVAPVAATAAGQSPTSAAAVVHAPLVHSSLSQHVWPLLAPPVHVAPPHCWSSEQKGLGRPRTALATALGEVALQDLTVTPGFT